MIRQTHIARVSGTLRRGCGAAFAAGVAAGVRGICGRVVRWMLAAAAALCCVACIYEFAEEPAPMSVRFLDGESIALQVSMFDIIEDRDDAHSDIERMHNLRVIITHRDADSREVIEYNRLIEFGEGTGRFRYGYVDDARLMFKIEQGSDPDKHIYLFANSEPILMRMLSETDGLKELSSQPDPEDGIYGGNHYIPVDQNTADIYLKALRDVTFTNKELQEFVTPPEGGAPNGLPMSAEYDIQFSPGNAGVPDVHILNAYIVRAANKITFTYQNKRYNGDIFVTKWSLNNTADITYLLPHVTDTKHGDWIRWYAEHSANNTAGHGKELEFTVAPTATYNPFASEYTQLNDSAESHDSFTELNSVRGLKLPEMDPATGITSITDSTTYYFLESRYCPNEDEPGKQTYRMSFTAKEYNASADVGTRWQEVTYPSAGNSYILDKVTTLFRNTHVKINAAFDEKGQVELGVSLINWERDTAPTEGTLDPE